MESVYTFEHPGVPKDDTAVYDARNHPFRLYGLYRPEEEGIFKRMPYEAASKAGKRVGLLYANTAGARLRFSTDSDFIAVGAVYPPFSIPSARTAALCGAGAFCFDLYADGEYCRVLWPEECVQEGNVPGFRIMEGRYEAVHFFSEKKERQITLNFPSFVNVSKLYIGLGKGAALNGPQPYVNEKPVVFYGSSITQGACASHPGNTYENVLSRKLNIDYVNLGFASGAKADDSVMEHICSLDLSMLVFDYDHNAKTPEFLKETHLPALRKIRSSHPDIPIVLMSRPNRDGGEEAVKERIGIIKDSCRILGEEFPGPVHFINGQDVFNKCDSEMMTVDGTHPTDLGHYCIAEALREVLVRYYGQ